MFVRYNIIYDFQRRLSNLFWNYFHFFANIFYRSITYIFPNAHDSSHKQLASDRAGLINFRVFKRLAVCIKFRYFPGFANLALGRVRKVRKSRKRDYFNPVSPYLPMTRELQKT